MMKSPAVSTVLMLFVMCAVLLPSQLHSASETGIEGVITIVPAQPGPVRANGPGSQPLAHAAFVVENQKGEVTLFTTDAQGRFRIPLAPGHYKVSLKGKTSGVGKFGPFEVDVVAGQMTNVQWKCDSGMR
jgi:hypothetical protein